MGGIIPEEIWFHKYRIIKQLGRGGSANVFLAWHLKLKCLRAIKRVSKNHPYYAGLMNEARILKNLKHPNIPVIYDMEEDEGFSYIIEEYIQGQSLKAFRLNQCNVQEKTVIELSIQICNIFKSLHIAEHPILYLDLKPDNLMIEGNILKLIDFGASVYEQEATGRQASFGTADYAAPEQFGPRPVDERSDIYSIGMLIYFLASGKEFKNFVYSGGRSRRPIELCQGIGEGLKKIISKCLKFYPQQRYRSVVELQKELMQLKKRGLCKETTNTSQVFKIAGTQSRIGTTHVWQMLSAIFREEGTELVDMGVLTEDNREAFLASDKKLLVAGTKGMEWNHTCRCLNLLSGITEVIYLMNFQDGILFREAVKTMGDRKCLRVPFCPNPEKAGEQETVREMVQEIWKHRGKRKKSLAASAGNGRPKGKIMIGLTGTHRGAGVTHTAIALAFYLKRIWGEKTACIEMNGSQDLQRFKAAFCKDEAALQGEFQVEDVTFFESVTKGRMADIMNRDISCFILDFGTELVKYRNEFLRCSSKLVLCSQTVWKREYLYQFIQRWRGEPGFNSWNFLTVSGREYKKVFLNPISGGDRIKLFHIGFYPDPTDVPVEAEKILKLMI